MKGVFKHRCHLLKFKLSVAFMSGSTARDRTSALLPLCGFDSHRGNSLGLNINMLATEPVSTSSSTNIVALLNWPNG